MTSEMILFILIIAAGFYMAWNIGANDVANAMGTSVGSGALTLRQAIYIASVLEFSGAFFFGSHVSETMQSGIINAEFFASYPKALLLGMLSSLIGTGIWLQIASYFGWPVSTTHTIVGALVGFGMIIGGVDSIHWDKVFYIASSWIATPFIGGLLAYMLFSLIRQKIFFAPYPLAAARKLMPYLVFAVFTLLSLFLVFDGLDNLHLALNAFEASILSVGIGLAASLFTQLLLNRLNLVHVASSSPELVQELEIARQDLQKAKNLVSQHDQLKLDYLISDLGSKVQALEHADEFDYTKADFALIEKMFGWLQVLSACLMAFAHGANDVANAIGPLAAAIHILQTGAVSFYAVVPPWTLALGGLGIVVGLATWGWRVIETIGKKITELTPTRGFAAEFGAAITILAASRLGMPISTTHTLVGAVIGVGLARGIEALNIGMTRDIVTSWVVTLPAGALASVTIYTLLEALF